MSVSIALYSSKYVGLPLKKESNQAKKGLVLYLIVVLFYINDTEHLCISLFAICTSFLVKYLNLWHIFYWVPLLLSFKDFY